MGHVELNNLPQEEDITLYRGMLIRCLEKEVMPFYDQWEKHGLMPRGVWNTLGAAGSDLAGMRTTAVRDGDEFVINGSKTFVTNGLHSDARVQTIYAGTSEIMKEIIAPGMLGR